MTDLTFSIVVPTYNEESDIRRTCEALIHLDYPHKEIIVVDGNSADRTRDVVSQFPSIKLICESSRRGVASARNIGITIARNDVVVILNADVFPDKNFLHQLAAHYNAGADYVGVDSQVVNTESLFPRFVQASHEYYFGREKPVSWTEGFSCRREVAITCGLFPEVIPGAGGEDVVFFQRLVNVSPNGVVDKSIVVPHIMPETLEGFWLQWEGRGRSIPFLRHRVYGELMWRLAFNRLMATAKSFAEIVLIVPMLWVAFQLCHYSSHRYSDFFLFVFAKIIALIAHRYGEWKGFIEINVNARHPTSRFKDVKQSEEAKIHEC